MVHAQAPLLSEVIPTERQSDEPEEIECNESQNKTNEEVEEGEEVDDEDVLPDMPSVSPDTMYVAGHLFHILRGVPEEARRVFTRLEYIENVMAEDIPEHLMAYEYTPEEYEEHEREEREMGPITYVG
ncbi:hypothetical protein BO94DRAFT_590842 [Aspergillus sclerotioniger CBS 115572]|uniref:Uncharacterized protein n=1 Tax=Aspergillus sclerotioniger CBS 115572 TaxID=1450535 RepID=A0A317V182_9EURO|nr:hypothetical protein BO94DRAFT_590842 [Aspergillus sclerotioniger CBS 115572]PWY68033.1 hypothetical protein BO94DRAFT_590842 [Aspergillus sclerotioniger CBS 115572]